VSLDRSTLEEMIDPLQHILRNSIDHGLETAEERRTAGKPARGRIEIELSRRDERVCLVVSDDGRGIDPQALRRVAVERRFLSRESATRLSDEEALMLVTIPGFSTAKRTTEISGRGVGMDVVRMRVQKLGGHLIIRSQVGVGTRMEMDLPPTVTVTATSLRGSSFSTAAAEIPMPNTAAPSRSPRKIVPGLAPNFSASSILKSARGPSASCFITSESR